MLGVNEPYPYPYPHPYPYPQPIPGQVHHKFPPQVWEGQYHRTTVPTAAQGMGGISPRTGPSEGGTYATQGLEPIPNPR